jgi:hypothetical protein
MTIRRVLGPSAALIVLLAGSGCTLAKPVVGAIAAPVIVLGSGSGSSYSYGCGDGRALVAALGVIAAAGAVCGLVTGIVSDVQALSGHCEDPCANWWDPFATN